METPPVLPATPFGGEPPRTEAEVQAVAGEMQLPSHQPEGLPPVDFPTAPPALPGVDSSRQEAPPRPAAGAARPAPTAFNGAEPMMPAMQSLVQQLLTAQATQLRQSFFLVVLPEDGLPRTETFETVVELQSRIIALQGTEAAIFAFMGHRLGVSKPPMRYLLTPFGNLPLFRVPGPHEVEVDESGWVGTEAQELEIPATPVESELSNEEVTTSPGLNETPMFDTDPVAR